MDRERKIEELEELVESVARQLHELRGECINLPTYAINNLSDALKAFPIPRPISNLHPRLQQHVRQTATRAEREAAYAKEFNPDGTFRVAPGMDAAGEQAALSEFEGEVK